MIKSEKDFRTVTLQNFCRGDGYVQLRRLLEEEETFGRINFFADIDH